jgi:hypothetical protein
MKKLVLILVVLVASLTGYSQPPLTTNPDDGVGLGPTDPDVTPLLPPYQCDPFCFRNETECPISITFNYADRYNPCTNQFDGMNQFPITVTLQPGESTCFADTDINTGCQFCYVKPFFSINTLDGINDDIPGFGFYAVRSPYIEYNDNGGRGRLHNCEGITDCQFDYASGIYVIRKIRLMGE